MCGEPVTNVGVVQHFPSYPLTVARVRSVVVPEAPVRFEAAAASAAGRGVQEQLDVAVIHVVLVASHCLGKR